MKKTTILVLALVPALLLASGLKLKVSFLEDTVLPVEPIWIQVTALNSSAKPLQVPDIARYYPGDLLFYDLRSSSGQRYGVRLTMEQYPTPSWRRATLAPGESLVSGLWQVRYSVGNATRIETGPVGALPPGEFTVRVSWQTDRVADFADSSAPATLTLREPDSSEKAAEELYERVDLYVTTTHSYFPDSRGQVESTTRQMIAESVAEPFRPLAKIALFTSFRSRLIGPEAHLTKPEDITAWKDSAGSAYLDVVHSYPNSPHVQVLLRYPYLSEIEGDYAHERLLAELIADYPGTRAALEAARQLSGGAKPTGRKYK